MNEPSDFGPIHSFPSFPHFYVFGIQFPLAFFHLRRIMENVEKHARRPREKR